MRTSQLPIIYFVYFICTVFGLLNPAIAHDIKNILNISYAPFFDCQTNYLQYFQQPLDFIAEIDCNLFKGAAPQLHIARSVFP